jgi:glutathione S-transferase
MVALSNTLKLYQSAGSPNSRRVRIFLAEREFALTLVPIDLAKGVQRSDEYRMLNPRQMVPALVLEDGTASGEVLAIWCYLEETHPTKPLLGTTPKSKALVTMWERRAELDGFAAVVEGVRNAAAGLKDRAIARPHDYEQIPALVQRSKLRVANFLSDLDVRLTDAPVSRRRRILGSGYYGAGGSRVRRQGARDTDAKGTPSPETLVRRGLCPGRHKCMRPTTFKPHESTLDDTGGRDI